MINVAGDPTSILSIKFTTLTAKYFPGWIDSKDIPIDELRSRTEGVSPSKITNINCERSTVVFNFSPPVCIYDNNSLERIKNALHIKNQTVTFSLNIDDDFYNLVFSMELIDVLKLLLKSPYVCDFKAFARDKTVYCNVRFVTKLALGNLFQGVSYQARRITKEQYSANEYLVFGESSYICLEHYHLQIILEKTVPIEEFQALYEAFDRRVFLIQAWDGKDLYFTLR